MAPRPGRRRREGRSAIPDARPPPDCRGSGAVVVGLPPESLSTSFRNPCPLCFGIRNLPPDLLRRRENLVHNWMEGTSPVLVRAVHLDVDEDGHEEGEERGAVAHLVPVDPAVPGRAAVDAPVTKDVEPVEDEAKDADGVPLLEGAPGATLRRPEPFGCAGQPTDAAKSAEPSRLRTGRSSANTSCPSLRVLCGHLEMIRVESEHKVENSA